MIEKYSHIPLCSCSHVSLLFNSGDSFERSAILDWLSKNENCPLSRRPLTTSDLFDNKGLKTFINQAIQQKEAEEVQKQKDLHLQQLQQLQQQVEEQIKGLLSTKSSGLICFFFPSSSSLQLLFTHSSSSSVSTILRIPVALF